MGRINRRTFLQSTPLLGSSAILASASLATGAEKPPQPAGGTYQFSRQIPAEKGYDLVVAGGGPAGAAAAICAARLGAKVLLLEATGCMGGMGTSGLVTAFDPMSDGKQMIVGGLMREIVTTMHKRGFLAPQVTEAYYTTKFHCWTPFRVEGYKLILDELVQAAGVEVRFFTRAVDADFDAAKGTIKGVIVHNIEGFRYVPAKTFVDATGDAVLATLCGAKCREAGRETPYAMPPTLCSQCAGIDWTQTRKASQQKLVEKAIAENQFTFRDRHLPGLIQVGHTVGMLNAGHVFHMNALRCRSLSDGMMLGRKLAQEYINFYRKYVPGCENLEHVTTANLMGVRESRRIVGEYELNYADYAARRQFPDQIAVYNAAVDIHVYDDSEAEYQRYYKEFNETARLKPGECIGLPYGILVPKGWKNLWVAGRANSSDVRVHGCIRVQPPASMMGQAVGTAAVQSMATGQPACDLDTARLVETLRGAGAYLPQTELRKTMTRGPVS